MLYLSCCASCCLRNTQQSTVTCLVLPTCCLCDKSLRPVHWIRWCERYKTVQDAAWLEEVQCREDKTAKRFFLLPSLFCLGSHWNAGTHGWFSLVDNPAVCKVFFFFPAISASSGLVGHVRNKNPGKPGLWLIPATSVCGSEVLNWRVS
jgi:hypothetical protein